MNPSTATRSLCCFFRSGKECQRQTKGQSFFVRRVGFHKRRRRFFIPISGNAFAVFIFSIAQHLEAVSVLVRDEGETLVNFFFHDYTAITIEPMVKRA